MYFAQMCPQNAGNAVSETQNSKYFRRSMPPDTLQLCRHYGLPLNKILATLLSVNTFSKQTEIDLRSIQLYIDLSVNGPYNGRFRMYIFILYNLVSRYFSPEGRTQPRVRQ